MSGIVYNPFTGNFDFGGDGVGDLTGYNFTVSDLVTDAP